MKNVELYGRVRYAVRLEGLSECPQAAPKSRPARASVCADAWAWLDSLSRIH